MEGSRLIPETVKIGGYTVTVVFKENLMCDESACGQYRPREKIIQIDPATCPEQQYATFLHEVVEAITEIYELPSLSANHHDIVILSEALHQLLRDNGASVLPEVDIRGH